MRVEIRHKIIFIIRLVLVFAAMLFAFFISGTLIDTGIRLTPEESSQSAAALVIVSLLNSLVLAFLILRSRWHGLKLIGAVILVHFGVQSFMTQIETLFFINALKMPLTMVLSIVASGLVRAVIFAPLAVLALGKMKGTSSAGDPSRLAMRLPEWIKRIAVLAIAYVFVYFFFGFFVAYQWTETRDYYAGTFASDLVLPMFQLLRGAIWALLALPIVKMINGPAWEVCLAVALGFAVLIASGVIFPNPFMPPMVRQAHFVELSSSMLTYGAFVGWVWTRGVKDTKSREMLNAKSV